jgi:hypothetical protein
MVYTYQFLNLTDIGFVGDGISYKYVAPLGLKCTTFTVKI